jgi:predicted PurR-regulated permease PerM
MFPLDPMLGPFIGWALVSIYVWARDELPHDAVYEVG